MHPPMTRWVAIVATATFAAVLFAVIITQTYVDGRVLNDRLRESCEVIRSDRVDDVRRLDAVIFAAKAVVTADKLVSIDPDQPQRTRRALAAQARAERAVLEASIAVRRSKQSRVRACPERFPEPSLLPWR